MSEAEAMIVDVMVPKTASAERFARALPKGTYRSLHRVDGYMQGVRELTALTNPPDCVLLVSADANEDPRAVGALLAPLRENKYDLVLGARGNLPAAMRVGSYVAASLIQMFFGRRFTDIGGLRAVRFPALVALGLREDGAGAQIEMLVKAATIGLRVGEVPIPCVKASGNRRRPGRTLKGAAGLSYRAIYTILRHATAR